MKKLLNTLYVTTPDAYLSLDGENIVLLQDKNELGRVPLHNLEGIVCFGYRGVSPALMGACAEKGIGLCFLTQYGRFLARISGPVSGNVILRKTQYLQSPKKTRQQRKGCLQCRLRHDCTIYNVTHTCTQGAQHCCLHNVHATYNQNYTTIAQKV